MAETGGVVQRRQLVDAVIMRLEEAIDAGRYALGARLPAEQRLMDEFGVGRSTVREAVRVLAHSGVLEVRQGDGTYVRGAPGASEPLSRRLSRAEAGDVQEVRRALELETVRLAALRRTPGDLERLGEQLAARATALAAGDWAAALDADIAFHCAVADAGGNAVLADLYRAFAARLRTALAALWSVEGNPQDAADLHRRLLDAIGAGDAPAAIAVAATLLDRHDAALRGPDLP